MSPHSVLSARSVSWRVGESEVLRPLDFALGSGECVAIVGPNGAGKTTLLRLLAGLLAPTTGELVLDGRPLATIRRRDLARRIAYVPQIRPARIPLSVEQIVLLGRYPYLSPLQMAPGAQDVAVVEEILQRVGLSELRGRLLDSLSGGERQSVFIAAALAQQTEVLLLDEPTTHLDPRHQLEVAELLAGIRADGEHTIVLTSHDLNLAASMADRIVALRGGEIVATGSPAEIVRPDRLGEIFDARFDAVGAVDQPRVLLRLDS